MAIHRLTPRQVKRLLWLYDNTEWSIPEIAKLVRFKVRPKSVKYHIKRRLRKWL